MRCKGASKASKMPWCKPAIENENTDQRNDAICSPFVFFSPHVMNREFSRSYLKLKVQPNNADT